MALTDKLTAIGNAIRTKTGGSALIPLSDMPAEILSIETGEVPTQNPALILWDWEGTKLAEYSREDALALTELPAPSTFPAYEIVDHELLLFQTWNWDLVTLKTWIQNHSGRTLGVGAIYTTNDNMDHNYWSTPRLNTADTINMQKRGTPSIGNNEFGLNYALVKLNIPNGVTSIGDNAFQFNYSLIAIIIPDGVTSIGNNAFQACQTLIAISVPDSVTSIGQNAFQYCRSFIRINIPGSVTSIGNNAFEACTSLRQVSIGDGVTSIVQYMFRYCYTLSRINIPDSVTSIGQYAFQSCRALSRINIPDSVTSIGQYAFQDCSTLCEILMESKPTLANINALSGLPSNYRIYVPRNNLSWFKVATNWSSVYWSHIVAIEDYIDHLEAIGFNVDNYKEVA